MRDTTLQSGVRRIALITFVALVITACTASTSSLEGAWQLETGTFDGMPIPMVASHPIAMTLEGDQITGTAACNGYGGTFQVSGGLFSITEFAITEMACSPAEVMTSERVYINALFNVEKAETISGKLVMSGSRTEMVFTELQPVPTADLTGVLDSLIQDDTVSSPATRA